MVDDSNHPNLIPRIIALYLPQFHPIPENDAWWGAGFTEWTNVRKAQPRFPGHYQPHQPGELGYYDLRDSSVRKAQADLARKHGIYGFCYYHYWFNGKRLLETPFNEVLKSGEPDFPFCLCWANENWTRRWDGAEQEILMAQHYSDEDSLAFIIDLIPAFRDERYIRVNGKPLLLVYRTSLLPEPKRTTEIWRKAMQEAGIGDIYLVRVENHIDSRVEVAPEDIGFDAAMEFAPYWGSIGERLDNLSQIGLEDIPIEEDVDVFDYLSCMGMMIERNKPDYKLFRGVFPMWDNSARRKVNPTIFADSSPAAYGVWLSEMLRYTRENFACDEQLLFVNAWNEWGEGCHLEPDARHGMQYLEHTRLALSRANDDLAPAQRSRSSNSEGSYPLYKDLPVIPRDTYAIKERDELILRLLKRTAQIPELRSQLSLMQEVLVNIDYLEHQIKILNEKLQQKNNSINSLLNSLSWRITSPLRTLHSLITGYRSRFTPNHSDDECFRFNDDLMLSRIPKDPFIKTALNAKGTGYDVIVFPVIDWHFRIQRPQQIAKQLGLRGHRVFYLSLQFNGEDKTPGFTITESPSQNVFLVELNSHLPHPNVYRDVLSNAQRDTILKSLYLLYFHCEIGPLVCKVDLSFWRVFAEALPGAMIVYDCMDHHAGFSTNAAAILKEEMKLLETADLVVTSSQRLSENVGQKRENIIIRNGVDADFFKEKPETGALSSDKPVVGYYGAISDWFDLDLVIAAAKAYPEWQFILVGSTAGCDTKHAEVISNITFMGEVPYSNIPGWLHSFDVCIIPFRIMELTLCTNPVKVYEYLAAGKPVVATNLPELKLISDQVHLAGTSGEFIEKLAIAMSESREDSLGRIRSEWACGQDWSSRTAELMSRVDELYPKVSIIVLTYNNLDLTKACLESIEMYTKYPDWELIIVDNDSHDGTPEFLCEFAETRGNVKVILNDKNLGFAGGNNSGAKAATGEYLIILNNDTYVSHGWLTSLIRHLRRDDKLGIVGPVTNCIGNEAQIPVTYESMQEMQLRALEYTMQHSRKLLYVRTVAFFCVALRKSTWDAIGQLDEEFSVGFFEDDDYCRRLEQAGLKIAIAEDVFVHHQHSASFNTLVAERRNAIFEANKKVYEKKWGTWTPHEYR